MNKENTLENQRIKRAISQLVTDPKNQKKWSYENFGNRAILEERVQLLETLLRGQGLLPLEGKKILEVGCGNGKELARLEALGAEAKNLFGVDLVESRIEEARKNYPQYSFSVGSADCLQFASESFDGVMFFTVLSSILDPFLKKRVAQEASRVLKCGGFILWYDFRYPSHVNRNTCPISSVELNTLFEGFTIDKRPVTILPPLVRFLGKSNRFLYPILSNFPVFKSHYMGLFRKN